MPWGWRRGIATRGDGHYSDHIRAKDKVNIMTDATLLADAERELGLTLASHIREIRQRQKLSLDGLARRSGLSKGTVVALEQGKANPSIGILCRLAAAFSLSVTDLLGDPPSGVSGSPIERTVPKTLWESANGSFARLHASTSGHTMFELWSWRLMPGDVFHSDAHSPDTRELISVGEGSLEITVGSEILILAAGESARLATDRAHSYAAAADQPTVFTMAVLERGAGREGGV